MNSSSDMVYINRECTLCDIREAHDMVLEMQQEGIDISITDVLIAKLIGTLEVSDENTLNALSEINDTLFNVS